MNMLRPSRLVPNVSAHAHLHGQHDYNAHPLAPLGCAVEMHVVPDVRETFAPHSVSGYHLGTSLEHYRCYKIWIKKTRSERIGNTVFFKHKYLTMPTITNADALLIAAKDMSTALEGGVTKSLETVDAVKKLMEIFKRKAQDEKRREKESQPQRVHIDEAQEQRVAEERQHQEDESPH